MTDPLRPRGRVPAGYSRRGDSRKRWSPVGTGREDTPTAGAFMPDVGRGESAEATAGDALGPPADRPTGANGSLRHGRPMFAGEPLDGQRIAPPRRSGRRTRSRRARSTANSTSSARSEVSRCSAASSRPTESGSSSTGASSTSGRWGCAAPGCGSASGSATLPPIGSKRCGATIERRPAARDVPRRVDRDRPVDNHHRPRPRSRSWRSRRPARAGRAVSCSSASASSCAPSSRGPCGSGLLFRRRRGHGRSRGPRGDDRGIGHGPREPDGTDRRSVRTPGPVPKRPRTRVGSRRP